MTDIDDNPVWLKKMIRRQQSLNKKYERAHGEFAQAYNEFLMTIDEINSEHGTEFDFQQAANEYDGLFANDASGETDED